jgi:hypothetical protein
MKSDKETVCLTVMAVVIIILGIMSLYSLDDDRVSLFDLMYGGSKYGTK